MDSLKNDFHKAMLNLYLTAKTEARYTAKAFLDMVVSRGGLETAKALINASKPSVGYTHLYERGRLDLTVEAMVVRDTRWHALFLQTEIEAAKRRLRQFGFQISGSR